MKTRFGIIGTNFVTDWVIEAMREDSRVSVEAVYSRTQERAEAFAKKYAIPHRFTSLEEMASNNLIDAVYIASPNSCHAPQSILFMDHGKHVLCEKPLASNSREVKEMIAAARRNGVVLMEALKTTLTPNFRSVLDNLERLGKPRNYFATFCQYSSRYDKFKAGIVLNAFNPELSNGAAMDVGIYTIYPMVVLFGRPYSIKATGLKLHTGVDGSGSVVFSYDGMNAVVIYSKASDSILPTEIQGEDGSIILDRINTISRVLFRSRVDKSEEDITYGRDRHEYFYQIEEFVSLIERGENESKINSLDNSLAVIEIIEEIRRQIGIVYPADGIITAAE
jgi:predicted dehydrogenase